ncbi:MAG: hypothetical protein PHT40_00685 [Patescibacteria group bacterium]|nr:hypothetical protein [Patescibacteria group bacterium]
MGVPQQGDWKTVAKPGWFGEAKNDMLAHFDQDYGAGNWRIRHRLGPRLLNLPEALRLYELCYELHFLNPNTRFLWTKLFEQACEVWTEYESDVESGLDYSIQKAKAPHYEDVSIRIIMKQYGHQFGGERLIRVRADSNDVIGIALSSIHIPFVFPEFIESDAHGVQWWNRHRGSLEHFWHANKELQVAFKK